jgi:hypothetical protein
MIARKDNAAVYVLQPELCFLYWKFNIVKTLYINASFHHSRRITPTNKTFTSVLLPRSGLRLQFLGRALAALRSIGMTNRHVDGHSAY